jgi:SagB-type dehydrogenase family enzyme
MKKKNPFSNASPGLSRREFLKAAALAGGALTLSGCASTPAPLDSSASEPALISTGCGATPTVPITPQYLPQIDGSFSSLALPAPRTEGGLPLMQALKARISRRAYGPEEIPVHILSDLLWAAFGISRLAQGLRTAPTAVNSQDIDIYLATAKGLFLYKPETHALQIVLPDDLRSQTGTQSFAADAPLNLLYVSDYEKLSGLAAGEYGQMNLSWSWIHTGFISQNVYLYCASEGLATVVRAYVERDALEDKMGLASGKHITMAQSVGYPG